LGRKGNVWGVYPGRREGSMVIEPTLCPGLGER
jgi:hypothetical protein